MIPGGKPPLFPILQNEFVVGLGKLIQVIFYMRGVNTKAMKELGGP